MRSAVARTSSAGARQARITASAARLRTTAARWAVPGALVAVLVVGAWLRIANANWDSGAHLHPDERYMTIVGDQISWPSSVAQYFDVRRSPLSPYNTPAGTSYLYGLLPLLATKAVATAVRQDNYAQLNIVGRRVSGIVDTASILLVFLLARLLLAARDRRRATAGALLAAAFYAFAVLAVQYSHFFTVESWLVFTTLLALYLAGRVSPRPFEERTSAETLLLLAAVGAAVGLVAASKVSGLLVCLPVAIALVLRPGSGLPLRVRAVGIGVSVLTVAVAAYVVFRLVSPYAFQHSNWLYLQPNEDLRRALAEQQQALHGTYLYPPAYQWLLSTPVWSPLRNLVVWGLGVPLGLAGLAGLGWMTVDGVRDVRRRRPPVLEAMLVSFALLVFFYFGSLFAHSIRYLVPLAPLLAIAGAYSLVRLERLNPFVGRSAAAGVLLATALYALAFVQIYRHTNTRIAATGWIERNVAPGSTIVSEAWDDALPISGGDRYRLRELPVFDADDGTKLRKLYNGLSGADVYALSSPRAWKTIGRLPGRFPVMTRFYDRLAAGDLGFRRAAEFTSEPRLLGVELHDLDAEEAFWVYDHPPVILYRRTAALSWPAFRSAMCGGPTTLPGC